MKHFLYNADYEQVALFEEFNRERIRAAIVKYLTEHPNDMLTHEKECKNNRTVGNDVIDFFQVHNDKVCKVITRGNREYFKPI